MTNKEIRDSIRPPKVDDIQNATRLDVLTQIENLALWKGGNTAEEKINHFFKIIEETKQTLKQ